MTPVTRDELIFTIAYAIARNVRLLPRYRTIDCSRMLAQKIVEQMALERLTVMRPVQREPHSTR